jgi:MFS family permease
MAFKPVGSLNHRTFIGLIIAQFLAGFNDQAIHASAMFFALHQQILTEAQAISLMPILFFSPWAIFCTLAGFSADRYSKTYSLILWKISEIAIALIALAGFYLGSVHHLPIGGWIVLSTVFLMGTHAAFFAPAKYGAMPEILQPHILSRGNGVLESTTFLAAILGTVTGGLLSSALFFKGQESWIGLVLLVLALIGAGASFLIAKLPPANPTRTFQLIKPLFANLKTIFRSKALTLSALGIAFFVFMVAFMRQTMYMHGETRLPRWDELTTSLVVATVALGVGLGAPFAGYLSGGKVELGLVPLGCLGMVMATLIAAFAIDHTVALVIALIVMGFFSGFYMVPLYTLLQHRAPKTSKGDLVATSNFINVTGAMAASLLFFLLVAAGKLFDITPSISQESQVFGVLEAIEKDHHGHLKRFTLRTADGTVTFKEMKVQTPSMDVNDRAEVIHHDDGLLELFGDAVSPGSKVAVSAYKMHGVTHYFLRIAGEDSPTVYDNSQLPQYLFFGAAFMTLGILLLLWSKLPDFFVRALFWLKSLGKYQLRAVGMQHLPTTGPVLLATNCASLESSLQLVAATDRFTMVTLIDPDSMKGGSLLRKLARLRNLIVLDGTADKNDWKTAQDKARAILNQGNMLAVGIFSQVPQMASFLHELTQLSSAQLLPIYCGPLDVAGSRRIRVVFGAPLPVTTPLEKLRKEINDLADWIRLNDDKAGWTEH